MALEKPLELLKLRHLGDAAHANTDLYKADQLAIEALERLQQIKRLYPPITTDPLPSEEPE